MVGGGGTAPAGSLPSFKGARFNYKTMSFDAKSVRVLPSTSSWRSGTPCRA